MKYLLTILIFISLKSSGQVQLFHMHNQGAALKILDYYPTTGAAYSLRKLDKDYTGYAIRVRRSNDDSETDIGFTGSGDLDEAAITSFGGANSCYVTTIYDQSGSNRNFNQTTGTAQAAIMLSGVIQTQGARPSMYFDGGDSYVSTDTLGNGKDYVAHLFVGKNGGTNDRHFFDSQGATHRHVLGVSGGNLIIFAMNGVVSFGANNTNYALFYALINKTGATSLSNDDLARNNASAVTGAAGNFEFRNPRLGAADAGFGVSPITGYISEWIIWESNIDRTSVSNNINSYYSIY